MISGLQGCRGTTVTVVALLYRYYLNHGLTLAKERAVTIAQQGHLVRLILWRCSSLPSL